MSQRASCNIRAAMVSLELMGFHHDWHDAQIGRGPRFFGEAADEPSLGQLLTVLAALKGVPKASARPEFVAGLRERLLAEAVTRPRGQETRTVQEPKTDAALGPRVGQVGMKSNGGPTAREGRLDLPGIMRWPPSHG